MSDEAQSALTNEAIRLLQLQLSQPQPCVAQASVVLGILQDRLFTHSTEPLQQAVSQTIQRFQEVFVAPAAAKVNKCKTAQDKVVAIAKLLRGKLAKAPAHKQPLHTQYLPSALRDSGKRQLDCLGIATAVLTMCHHIAAQQPEQHGFLAAACMVVSDDHCWLSVPVRAAGQTVGDGTDNDQQPHQVFVEVTDPGVLKADQMSGTWLYAGGHGTPCSPAQVLMVLVAGLMPEELSDESTAEQLRGVQLQMLQQLSTAHPEALFYSNFFRWGMLHEESELQQLAEAAEAAAATGDMAGLQALALLPAAQLQSQQHYSTSLQLSTGWQWHPSSCAAFGWLNRMQAALCGETDNLLCLTQTHKQQQQHQEAGGSVRPWLDIAVFLLQQALQAVAGCTAVLRQYSGCAGKPNKAADTQLMEAVRDLWQNLADASKAVAYLEHLQAQQTEHQHQDRQQQGAQPGEPLEQEKKPQPLQPQHSDKSNHQQQDQQQQQELDSSLGGHVGADMPAAAAVPSHTVHLAAAVHKATAGADSSAQPGTAVVTMRNVISNSSWLQAHLHFLDALLCFFGEDSADLPAGIVTDFITVAGTYSSAARVRAVGDAVSQGVVFSGRVHGLVGSAAWADLEPGLQQMLQMPGTRSRKRQRKE